MGLCAVSRWCEGCRNKGNAQLTSTLDRISERITLAFQSLSRPEAIRGHHRKQQFILYFNKIWRRECQSIPIERQSIFDLSRPKPTVRATAGKWSFAFGKSLCTQWRHVVEIDSTRPHSRIRCYGIDPDVRPPAVFARSPGRTIRRRASPRRHQVTRRFTRLV
jgi:hypothetical protein